MKRAILPTALLLLLAATTVLAAPPDPPASVWFYDGFETYTLVDGGGYFTRLANCAPNWGGMTNTEWGGAWGTGMACLSVCHLMSETDSTLYACTGNQYVKLMGEQGNYDGCGSLTQPPCTGRGQRADTALQDEKAGLRHGKPVVPRGRLHARFGQCLPDGLAGRKRIHAAPVEPAHDRQHGIARGRLERVRLTRANGLPGESMLHRQPHRPRLPGLGQRRDHGFGDQQSNRCASDRPAPLGVRERAIRRLDGLVPAGPTAGSTVSPRFPQRRRPAYWTFSAARSLGSSRQ